MNSKVDYDKELKNTIGILDEFFAQTSGMLSNLREVLEKKHGYKVIGDNAIIRENSLHLSQHDKWTPVYLSYSFQKSDTENTVTSVVIALKDRNFSPLERYHIYGFKFSNVDKDKRLDRLLGVNALKDMVGESKGKELDKYYQFSPSKRSKSVGGHYFMWSLWEMSGPDEVTDFAKKLDNCP